MRQVLLPADRVVIGRYEVAWAFIDPQATAIVSPGLLTKARSVPPPLIPARRVLRGRRGA